MLNSMSSLPVRWFNPLYGPKQKPTWAPQKQQNKKSPKPQKLLSQDLFLVWELTGAIAHAGLILVPIWFALSSWHNTHPAEMSAISLVAAVLFGTVYLTAKTFILKRNHPAEKQLIHKSEQSMPLPFVVKHRSWFVVSLILIFASGIAYNSL